MWYLNAKVSSIDIVSQKEIPRLGRVATHFEQLHKIVVLAVDVATHGDGRVHFEQIRFGLEDLGAFLEDPQGLFFGQAAFTVEVLLEEL